MTTASLFCYNNKMKELTPLVAHCIIDELQGTCKTIEEICDYYEVDPDEFLDKFASELDEQIFNCDRCGWWCEVGDYGNSEDGMSICSNCEEDADE